MNQSGGHGMHMGIMGAVVIVALLLGVGFGGAMVFALLACGTMMGLMVWMMMRPPGARGDGMSTRQPLQRKLDGEVDPESYESQRKV